MNEELLTPDLLEALFDDDEPAPPPVQTPALLLAPWPKKLPFDVAFGESDDILCAKYNLAPAALENLYLNPVFRREVADHQAVIRDEGITFKAKAKLQAEMYLENLHEIVVSQTAAPSVKLDAIKSMVKWAGYEPKPEAASTTAGGPSITINISKFSDDTDPAPNTIQVN
jgi:hypothetical protein